MPRPTLLALILCAPVLSGPAPSSAAQAQTAAPAQKLPVSPSHAAGQGTKSAVPPAQPSRPVLPPGMRLLDGREGRAIVQQMAWADDEEGLAPDCSHLVHHLYQKAGYPYAYANSLDLYRGTGPFFRVRYAQPGDLIVWRGHVGIVVNPKDHSFFSSLTSGARIGDYQSPYWKARGYPHFFRYLTGSPSKGADKTLQAANRPPEGQPKAQTTVRPGAPEKPGLQPVKTTPAPAVKATGASVADKARGGGLPAKPHAEVASASAARADNTAQIPLYTGGLPPKPADVVSALEAANLDAGEILRAANLERLERPVVVYRSLRVSGMELKGTRGTAEIQLETLATISPERMESLVGREEHQWDLQQLKKRWVISRTDQTIYVPRDGAMRVLAARLASLTQSTERGTDKDREQAAIVRFLNLLIQ